jgi:hypothetical protein
MLGMVLGSETGICIGVIRRIPHAGVNCQGIGVVIVKNNLITVGVRCWLLILIIHGACTTRKREREG